MMTRLTFCVFFMLIIGAFCAPDSEDKVIGDLELEDSKTSESRLVSQNIFRIPFLSNVAQQSPDSLQESSSNYVESLPTQQYVQPPIQQYVKPQIGPQLYPQQQVNLPVPYFKHQSANLYANPIQSSYGTGYINAPPFLNYTLLANVERLLQNIEPALEDLNRTRTLLWNARAVTLEVDIRVSPVVTVGGRSLSLGPRRGIHVFVISQTNGQIIDGVVFDLVEPGNSVRLINYLDAVGVGSYVVITANQDVFIGLNQSVLNYFIALGSRSASFLAPGDRWVFVVQVRPLTTSLAVTEVLSKAPECPTLNLPSLFLVTKLILE